jgi:hypothetical protein
VGAIVTVRGRTVDPIAVIGALAFFAASFLAPAVVEEVRSALTPPSCYGLAALCVLLGTRTLEASGELVVEGSRVAVGNLEIPRKQIGPGCLLSEGDRLVLVLPLRGWHSFRSSLVISAAADASTEFLSLRARNSEPMRLRLVATTTALFTGLAFGFVLALITVTLGLPKWLSVHAAFWPLIFPLLAPGWLRLGEDRLIIREWYGKRRIIAYDDIVEVITRKIESETEKLELKTKAGAIYRGAVADIPASVLARIIGSRRRASLGRGVVT